VGIPDQLARQQQRAALARGAARAPLDPLEVGDVVTAQDRAHARDAGEAQHVFENPAHVLALSLAQGFGAARALERRPRLLDAEVTSRARNQEHGAELAHGSLADLPEGLEAAEPSRDLGQAGEVAAEAALAQRCAAATTPSRPKGW
jgi:hypothetical protein